MFRHPQVTFVLAVAAVLSGWHGMRVDAQRIQQIGGNDIGDDEYTSFAAILTIIGAKFHCGGVVVGSLFVLTAQHCFDDNKNFFALFQVQVGYLCNVPANCGRQTELILIKSAWDHPGGGDMTLLELHKPISLPDMKPAVPYLGKEIHPDQPVPAARRKMFLVSAGREGTREAVSDRVQKLEVKYLGVKKCIKKISRKELIKDSTLCSTSKGNPCEGDSGSPLFVKGKGALKGQDVVVALHNWGSRDCSDPKAKETPNGHFRVADAADMLMKLICEGSQPEDWCPVVEKKSPLQIALWNTLIGHEGNAEAVAFHRNSSILASGACNDLDTPNKSFLRIWRPVDGERGMETVWTEGFPPSACAFSLAFNPVDESLLVGMYSGHVYVGRPEADSGAMTFSSPHSIFAGRVNSVAWHPSGTRFAVGTVSTGAIFYLPSEGTDSTNFTASGHSGDVQSLSFHPMGIRLASASSDTTIKVWNVVGNTLEEMHTFEGHSDSVMSVAFSPDGKLLASGSRDKTVRIWRATPSGGRLLQELQGHSDLVLSVAWSPDGKYVVSGSVDRTLRIWDVENFAPDPVATLAGHKKRVESVAWSSSGRLIASCSDDQRVLVWRVKRQSTS